MKRNSRRTSVLALVLMFLPAAGSGAALAQKAAGGGAKLMVTVTVPPICTVDVTPGEWASKDAIEVRCRNLPESHPQPVVSETTTISEPMIVSEASLEASGSPSAPADPVGMVVINF